MRPSAAATIALWASGVTPGARAFEDPSASCAGLWGGSGASGTVSIVVAGIVSNVVELVVGAMFASVVVGAFVLVLAFGGNSGLEDDELVGVTVLVVVAALVLVVVVGG